MRGGQRIYITLKADHHRPTSKHHLNGVSLAGRRYRNIECWLGNFVIFRGILTSIAKKTTIFCDFPGRGVRTPCPPLGPRINRNSLLTYLREQCRLHAASFSKHSYLTIPELEHPTISEVRKVIIKANKIAP